MSLEKVTDAPAERVARPCASSVVRLCGSAAAATRLRTIDFMRRGPVGSEVRGDAREANAQCSAMRSGSVRAIVRESAASQHTLASLVLGVVRSRPFQMREAGE